MNYCAIQCNGVASRDEMRSFVSIGDRRDSVVCPKPRRVGLLNTAFNEPSRPLRWHLGHQAELSDARAGSELLDIILCKGGYGAERPSSHVASPPPFYSGSPPSRVANPLVQDARFREEKEVVMPPFSQLQPSPFPPTAGSKIKSSPNSSARKGGCVRENFGNSPAVRIEGFDCLDRDRRNCSIPTLA